MRYRSRHPGQHRTILYGHYAGRGSDAIGERAEQAGCAAFFPKPFNGDSIPALLTSLASRSRT